MSGININDLVIPRYQAIFRDRHTSHLVVTSGRAGTKSSWAAVDAVATISDPNIKGSVVVMRKRHNKLRKTVYKEMLRAIQRLGLSKSAFKITLSPMEITNKRTGNTIFFTGSDNVDDTKGIIDDDRPIVLVVIDEVSEFFEQGEGEDELQNIEATFVRGNHGGFQMIYLYNPPKNPNAAVCKWCKKMEGRPDTIHVHSTYLDVPVEWLGQSLIDDAEMLRQIDERQYRWVWLGESIGVDETIYYMFSDRHIIPRDGDYPTVIIGVDYGQQNATTFQCFGLGHGRLDGLFEFYHSGRETGHQKSPSDYAQEFVKTVERLKNDYKTQLIYAFIDPSAQGLAEEIKRATRGLGIQIIIRNAENDVALGISRVQKLLTYDMLSVSPKQKNLIDEIRVYEYDRKSIERGVETPVKVDDHGCDATRYAVMGAWKQMKPFLPVREKEENYGYI